jgi:hypothetical protein
MMRSRVLHNNLSSSSLSLAPVLHTNSSLHKLIPEDSNQWVILALAPPPHETWIRHWHKRGLLEEEPVLGLVLELVLGLA